MWSIARLRQHPHFAPLFAHVHPLCWLVLWWQINRLIRWFEACRPDDVLYGVNRWGIVTVHYIAPKTDPDRYRPAARTFRPLSDPGWETNLPANLGSESTEARPALILPREAGGGGSLHRRLTEGAFAPPQPNTS